ncbi:hypothetical protein CP532_5869 [Ophiocordyceps camponoti-leonardi (nom. inval.)]|nr:hypothetical protein CP532_5869 [Ophiocordyceps camponoti-leonardi (nom. inval.)]
MTDHHEALQPIHPSMTGKLDPVFEELYNQHVAKTPAQPVDLTRLRASYSTLYSYGTGPAPDVGRVYDAEVPATSSSSSSSDKKDATTMVAVRVYEPATTTGPWPVHINFHGGGWGLGDLDTEAHVCRHLCAKAGVAVIDVAYRLVPEFAFPTAITDGFAALKYIHDAEGARRFNVRPDSISLGGVSAGACIALALAHLARDHDEPAPIPLRLVVVATPVIDDLSQYEKAADSPFPSMKENEMAPTLNWARLAWFDRLKWSTTTTTTTTTTGGGDGGRDDDDENAQQQRRRRRAAAGWFANLLTAPRYDSLAKTVIYTAGADPLRDEGERYAQLLMENGVEVTARRYPGVPHPFIHMDKHLWQARDLIERTAREVRLAHWDPSTADQRLTTAPMGSESRPVCHRCAQIKQACDGSLPCARCVRLSLPCRPRNSAATAAAATDDDFQGEMPKARIRRVQTGCLMCKRRKKNHDSSHGSLISHVTRHDATAAAAASSSTVSSSTTTTPSSYPPQDPPSDSNSTPVLPPPGSAASTVGEMILDMMSPDTVSWDMTGSPPGWIDAVTPASSGSSPAASLHSTPPGSSLSIYVPQLLPQLNAPQDKALLNHYSTIVSSILSRRCSPTNPYNHYLLPMAQGNDLVLHCILALSANHWRKLQPTLNDRGLIHKSKATQSLARLLPHVDRTSADIALVSSLLLCMTELFDGTSEGWKLHLKGAKRLLITLKKQQGEMMTGHYKFLLRLARFLDSAATTSTCRPPLIGEEEAEAVALDRMTSTPDEEDSAVYGIPKELFHLIDRVNTLADLRSTRVDEASEAAFRLHANEIEDRINHWSYERGGMPRVGGWTVPPPPSSSPSSSPPPSFPTQDDVVQATWAFEYAIRLRLHQIVEGYELTDPKVGHYVEGILHSVQKIRYGSPLESCLIFPLVMAGGSCWKLEHRLVIQDRLLIMERTCGFGYIYNARDLVERVWSRRDQAEGTGAIVNWARIRYYEMNGLVLF